MRGWGRFAAVVLLLAGCASNPLELAESEQHLLGRPDAQVRDCMGAPAETRVDGSTSTWVYKYVGLSNVPSQNCSLTIVFKTGHVSRVTSTDAAGAPLPQGQRCMPPELQWCATPIPAPPPKAPGTR